MKGFGFKGYDHRVWVLFTSRLIDGIGFSIVGPFLALFMYQGLGVPMVVVGLVLLVSGIAGAAGNLAGGLLADRYGRLGVMTYSMILRCLTFLALAVLVAFWPDIFAVAFVLSLSMFFGGVFDPANNAMVADVVEPARRLEAYGLLRVAWNLGFAFGPMIGGILLVFSYSVTFLVSALISLVAGLIVAFMLTESYVPGPAKERFTLVKELRNVKLLFLIFCLVCIPMFLMSGQFGTTYTVYANERVHIDTLTIGLVFGLNGVMVVLLQMPLARSLEKRDKYLAMTLGTVIYAVGYFLVAGVVEGITLAITMVIITIGEMIVVPVSTDLTVSMSSETERGKYLGIFGLIGSFGWFGSTLVGGILYDNLANGWIFWGSISALGMVTAVGMVALWARIRSEKVTVA
ncbi:MAG TPA: MFS transporter [Methanomassiliicoccales archaeon]